MLAPRGEGGEMAQLISVERVAKSEFASGPRGVSLLCLAEERFRGSGQP